MSSGEGKDRSLILQKQLSFKEFQKKQAEEERDIENFGIYFVKIPEFIKTSLLPMISLSLQDIQQKLINEKGIMEKDLVHFREFNFDQWKKLVDEKIPNYEDFYMFETADRFQPQSMFFFDIEHCGGTIEQSSILSIGCCEVISGKWFYSAVNPGSEEKLKTYTSHIHRLSADQLTRAPTWKTVGSNFIKFIHSFGAREVVFIHHSRSNVDESYLKSDNEKYGIQTPSNWKFLNAMKLLEELYPELATSQGGCGFSISALAKRENIGQRKKHDAKLDTQTTWAVLKTMLQRKFPNQNPIQVLFQRVTEEEQKPKRKKK